MALLGNPNCALAVAAAPPPNPFTNADKSIKLFNPKLNFHYCHLLSLHLSFDSSTGEAGYPPLAGRPHLGPITVAVFPPACRLVGR